MTQLPPVASFFYGWSGLDADKPVATHLPDNTRYLATDTEAEWAVIDGVWVEINGGGGSGFTPPQKYNPALTDDTDADLFGLGAVEPVLFGWGFNDGISWLQGGIGGTGPITGNLTCRVDDPTKFNSGETLAVYPSWCPDPIGTGPYLADFGMIGNGMILQVETGLIYPFDLVVASAHQRANFYMNAGLSAVASSPITIGAGAVTSTNPIVLASMDVITATWSTFPQAWD